MWRDLKNKCQPEKGRLSNNRWRLVVAIIFLLSGALVYKLFNVQIAQCDWYTALASSQHQIYSKLKPDRGRIFLSETINNQEKLYPIATNKDFAFIYAVPKDIADPRQMAEKLFDFFEVPRLTATLNKDLATGTSVIISTSTKEEILAKYLKKLNKPGDPYEPLENRVSTEELLRLYASWPTLVPRPSKRPIWK